MAFKDHKKEMEKQFKDLSTERNERCVPHAKAAIKIIADFDGPLGDIKPQEMQESYDALVRAVLEYMRDNGVRATETGYIKQLVLQKFDHVLSYVIASLDKNIVAATDILWNKKSDEVTLKDIDNVLLNK